jgi:hypothetical protein
MSRFLHIFSASYLMAVVLIRMMSMPISLAEYSLNKNLIASTLCENKARTEMHCAGSCFLAKKLARSNESQDAQNQKGNTKNTTVDFCESIDQPSFHLGIRKLNHAKTFINTEAPSLYSSSVFRPPMA